MFLGKEDTITIYIRFNYHKSKRILIDKAWSKIDFFVSYCPKDIHSIQDGKKNKRLTTRTYSWIYYFIVGKLARAFHPAINLDEMKKKIFGRFMYPTRNHSFITKGLNFLFLIYVTLDIDLDVIMLNYKK